ncbi:MAG: EsaB/YukD family protein, partial [Actinoplanes sp.]
MSETGRIDVALPAQSTIAELIPLLARAITPQGEHQGPFELSRLGGAPLPGDRTVAAAGLRDGELLHLAAVGHGTAVAVFDDLVEAVASNVRDAPGRWRPALSRRVATGVAVLAFGGAALAAATMATWPVGPITAGLTALLLLTAGVTLTRVRDAATIGAALAAAGLPCALSAVFGWTAGAFPTGPAAAALSATAASTTGPVGTEQGTALAASPTDPAQATALAASPTDPAQATALAASPTDPAQATALAEISATAMTTALGAVALYALLSALLLPAYRAWF